MSGKKKFFKRAKKLLSRIEQVLPVESTDPDWDKVHAFRWRRDDAAGHLQPVHHTSSIRLADLLGIKRQKQLIDRNTQQFLQKLPANNVLLWGPRGTGKSSIIKALLNEYGVNGLRIIEVETHHLTDLPDIVEQIMHRPERFIIFCDDLSFEANDSSYKPLKVVLDGSISSTPENVLVYATSNRRHLMPELKRENLDSRIIDGEIHHGEAIEEKTSLSERFGVWLAFHPFSQVTYLEIVFHWLQQLDTPLEEKEIIREEALRWALLHGSRSGRSAWHFARDRAGRVALENDEPSRNEVKG